MQQKMVVVLGLVLFLSGAVEGLKYAAEDPFKPDYIPSEYIQVEEKDFNEYYEWWNMIKWQLPKILYKSKYGENLTSTLENLPHNYNYDEAKYSEIHPIFNEDRYFLMKSGQNKEWDNIENYDLVMPRYLNQQNNYSLINAKNGDTHPSLNEHGFVCRQWFIVNETHAVDTKKMYKLAMDQVSKSFGGFAESIILTQSLVQPLADINDDNCFSDAIKSKLNQCFNNNLYCAVKNEGSVPELVVSNEHVVQVHHDVQVIMRYLNVNGTDGKHTFYKTPYYVLKHNENYYYFPQNLTTSLRDNYWNPVGTVNGSRVSLFPIFHENDLFLQRSDLNQSRGGGGQGGQGGTIIFDHPNIYINNMMVSFGAWLKDKFAYFLH